MSNINGDFTFGTAGTEDTIYGFSYNTVKPAAFEQNTTDAFLIAGPVTGSLYYNSGSVAAPHYFKISAFPSTIVNSVQLRITGVFINGLKVSGSDANVYWRPDDGTSAVVGGQGGTSIAGGVMSNANGVTPAFYVKAVDNFDGTFTPSGGGEGNDVVSTDNTVNGATASVNLAAVNDAPVNTVPGAQIIAEDNALNFGSSISASDLIDTSEGGVDGLSTIISVAHGTLTTAGGGAIITNDGTSSVTISGTAAQVNTALNGLVYQPTLDYVGADTLNVLTSDLGNSGTGGTLTDSDNISITMTAVNDAPVNTFNALPATGLATVSTNPSRVVVFSTANGNAIATSDVDVGTGVMQVQVWDATDSSASLVLGATEAAAFTAAGGVILWNPGYGVALQGTLAQINAALQNLTFTGQVGFTADQIYLYTDDLGNTGVPGFNVDTDYPIVTVVPSLPQITGETVPANDWYSAGENLDVTVTFDQIVNVAGGPPEIALTLSGSPGVVQAQYVSGSGTTTLTFRYTVVATNLDIDGIALAASINLNGGTILNAAAQAAANYNLVSVPSTAGVLVDAVPPVAPSLNGTITTDTGPSAVDNYTSDTTITVTGTAEANSTVKLYDGGVTLVGSAAADGIGNYTVTSSALSAAAHSLTTTATDAAGNEGVASAPVSVTVDTAAPGAPGISGTITTDTGVSAVDNITSDTTLAITGTTEANATVTLYDGVTSVGTGIADGAGNYTVTSSALSQAVHSLTTTATDLAGNVGPASSAVLATVDTTALAPVLSTTVVTDTGPSATDHVTSDTTIQVTGTAEANAAVDLYVDAILNASGVADGSGNFTITSLAMSAVAATGDPHSLTAVQTDVAGNVSGASAAVAVTVDITAPVAPVISNTIVTDTGPSIADNYTSDTTITVTGTTDANAVVTLWDGASNVGSASADGAGAYTVTSSALTEAAHTLTTTAMDLAGNVSAASLAVTPTVTIDLTPSNAPVVSLLAASDTGVSNSDGITSVNTPTIHVLLPVTGQAAIAGDVLTLTVGAVVTNVALTAPDILAGFVDVPSGALPDGTLAVAAKLTDLAGNISANSTTTITSITIDTVAPTPTFQSIVYDPYGADSLTITGTNLNSILALGANSGTDVAPQLAAASFDWDTGYQMGGPNNTGDLAGHIVSAYVTDNNTLVINLDGTEGFAPWNDDHGGTWGDYGNFDTAAFTNGFSSDLAGNVALGDGTGNLTIMGDNNEPGMPMVYTFDASGGSGTAVFNDTLGVDAGNTPSFDAHGYGAPGSSEEANWISQYGDVMPSDLVQQPDQITVSGVSAAQVDVLGNVGYDNGADSVLQINAIGSHVDNILHDGSDSASFALYGITAYGGSGNTSNFDDLNATNKPIVFSDGSLLVINVSGNNEVLSGTSHDDQLVADWGTNDRLAGNAGNDLLIGGGADNQLYGGSGNDVIFGWGGNDYLSGGSGADTFVFTKNADAYALVTSGRDTIADFTPGTDKIDITDVDPTTFLTFDGTLHLVASANAIQSGSDTLILLSANDSIRLVGVTLTNLTTTDFENVHFTVGGTQI